MLKYQKRSTDKIIIFGNNAQNHSVYRSDNKNEKIIVGKISNQEAQVLYTKNILYKNEECSQNFIAEIIANCIQKKYSTFIVINTNDDNLNLSICNDFVKSMNIMDEKNRVLCYSKLRIFTFGDPKLEKIYDDVVENGCGCISFVNKYKKVAIDLVAKHPFSQYLGENEFYPTYLVPHYETVNGVTEYVMRTSFNKFKVNSGEVVANVQNPYFNRTHEHFCSHMHTPNNPQEEFIGAVINNNIAYIGWDIFSAYALHGHLCFKELFKAVMEKMLGAEKTISESYGVKASIELNVKVSPDWDGNEHILRSMGCL
jgi:hypothetical protein